MKKILFFIVICFIAMGLYAQNEVDALRYSQTMYSGTARFTAMGGAFGALGADISVMATNPAGIALYRSSELATTPSLFYNKSKSTYAGEDAIDSKYKFNFGNVGFVSTYKSDKENNDWKTTSFGISYTRTNSFNNSVLIEGQNDNSSLIDLFVDRANGNRAENLDYFVEGLAFETGLIDYQNGDSSHYRNPFLNYGETQQKQIHTTGSVGEYVFSLGSNYKDMLYLGASLSIHRLNYTENSTYTETAEGYILSDLESFSYMQNISTSGTGYSFKLGAILRPIDWIRVGAAIHTPTFYTLQDNFNSKIEAKYISGNTYSSSSGDADFISDWELTTPIKAIASVGFVVNKMALVGIEYEYMDFSTAKLNDVKSGYSFNNENKSIQRSYKAVSNIRIGAEYAVDNFRIRGGFGYYDSPYKSSQLNKNAYELSFSGGFGIKTDYSFLDFSIVHSTGSTSQYLYTLQNNTGISAAKTTTASNQLLITLGYKF